METNESNNKKWKAFRKQSGNEISYADFCELQNRYASERISKEEVHQANKFLNDNGAQASQANNAPEPQTVDAQSNASAVVELEEEEKIFGMPKKVAYGVGIALLILLFAAGIYMWYSKRGDSTMPAVKGETAPATGAAVNSTDTTPAVGTAEGAK